MLHPRFLLREMYDARKQALIFTLCVALSITSMVALASFRRDLDRSISGDARALHGGDVIVHSHYDFTPKLLAAVRGLAGVTGQVRTWELYSVVRGAKSGTPLFSDILVVGPGYPLYGEVALQSGAPLEKRLGSGRVVVARELLRRLNLQVGDRIEIGRATMVISGIVKRESTRPVEIFSLGPRVLVAAADLPRLGLVETGSRVRYQLLLKTDNERHMHQAAAALAAAAAPGQERVSTFRTAHSGLKRFFDNLVFFLSLISVFTLLLAGIGMQSALSALLRQKRLSLAITRVLGAGQGFLFGHYGLLVLIFGVVGSCLGTFAGIVLKRGFPLLFAGLIPPGIIGGVHMGDVAQGLTLGLLVVVFFTFLPLYRLRDVKPSAVFRHESAGAGKGVVYYAAIAAGGVFVALLVIRQLADVKTGLYFMAGSIGLILVSSLLTRLLLLALGRLRIRFLAPRQAVRSLQRPGNGTAQVVVTLASALALLLAIFVVEHNLRVTYIQSYPPAAPNLFLIDIQPDQRQGLLQLIGRATRLHPIVRARLKAINGVPVRRRHIRRGFNDSLTREFNLTYRNTLLPDEALQQGGSLFRRDSTGKIPLQVSILDTVAKMGEMKIGDRLEFNIQGVPLTASVTSIRTRTKSRLYPFFYFVFPKTYLEKAPQTFFAALHENRDTIAPLEKKVVAAYPNISVINLADAAVALGELMQKLSGIVNFFALFSILAGALIIVSSILATRLARVREAVYYKILGGGSLFVFKVFVYENLILGLLSSGVAVLLAQAGSWALCHYLFGIAYHSFWPAALILIVLTMGLVTGLGLVSSLSIIGAKPIAFLREETIE